MKIYGDNIRKLSEKCMHVMLDKYDEPVALLEKELYDKTILIADDIRLHGRALEDVYAFW